MAERTWIESDSTGPGSPIVHGLYDDDTGSWQYIMACPVTRKAAIVDPVLDFSPQAARSSTGNAEALLTKVRDEGYALQWILDTHPHADHLTAGHWLKEQTSCPHLIGEKCREIAVLWRDLYHLPDGLDVAASYDRLLADGETFRLGDIEVRVMLSAGHTLGSISYVAGDAAMVHDTLMHVDVGSTRADFPGGSSSVLWDSIQAILALPEDTRLFVGHDYGTATRARPACEATVAEHRASNPHVGGTATRESFTALRDARDATLGLPDRMLHALQVNLRGGRLPEVEADGHSYFRIPANRF